MKTPTHAYGTIEAFADILRPRYVGVDYIPIEGLIQGILDSPSRTDSEKVADVRTALAAAKVVRAELAQR